MKVNITFGLYEDGQPGELFITMSKEGSTIGGFNGHRRDVDLDCLAIRRALESLVKKFAYQRFEPSGFTKNPDIRNATSNHRLCFPLSRLPVHQRLQGSDFA